MNREQGSAVNEKKQNLYEEDILFLNSTNEISHLSYQGFAGF